MAPTFPMSTCRVPHSPPLAPEALGGTRQRFHAWTFVVRASVDVIQALVDEIGEKERALEQMLQSPRPDPAATGALVLQIRARSLEIAGIIGALPALDEVEQTGEIRRAGPPFRRIVPASNRNVPPGGLRTMN